VIALLELGPAVLSDEESACLGTQLLHVTGREGSFLVVEPFVDLYDECREHAQPCEGRIEGEQLQHLSAAFHSSVLAFVSKTFRVEQSLVQREQSVP
jgi:hypothetical protein